MLTYKIGEFGQTFDPLQGEALSTRGWTLQERLLSRRTLHYSSDQMYFECQEGILAEDGASFPVWSRRIPQVRDLPITELSVALATASIAGGITPELMEPSAGSGVDQSWVDGWMRLVEDYSTRASTRSEDKLQPWVDSLVRSHNVAEPRTLPVSGTVGFSKLLRGRWRCRSLTTCAMTCT
jgi:hypothetical protein